MTKRIIFPEQHRISKVKEFLASDLTASEFCRRQGIPNSTFSVWRKRLKPKKITGRSTKVNLNQSALAAAALGFVPVTIIEASTSKHCEPDLQRLQGHSLVAMEMVLLSGGLIRIATNCPPSFLTAALAALAVQ
jgi:transposase-like protein